MARFERDGQAIELVREGTTIVEHTAFGTAHRTLHDERAALIAFYARALELIAERWVRQTPFVDELVVVPEPELVAQIDAGDRDALDVYTDWLLDRGDPRGELAALRRADTADERKIASLEKTRGVELFGPLSMVPRTWREQFAYVWRSGWIDEVIFRQVDVEGRHPPDPELMQHALHAPMARFVRWLSVDLWYVTPIWECLGACTCLQRIRGVRYSGSVQCFREMLDQLPALEELELFEADTTTGGHPRVRRLRMAVRSDSTLDVRGAWPSLRRLELVVHSPLALLRSLSIFDIPSLREIVIDADALGDDVVAAIVDRTAHAERIEIRAQLSPTGRRLLAARPS